MLQQSAGLSIKEKYTLLSKALDSCKEAETLTKSKEAKTWNDENLTGQLVFTLQAILYELISIDLHFSENPRDASEDISLSPKKMVPMKKTVSFENLTEGAGFKNGDITIKNESPKKQKNLTPSIAFLNKAKQHLKKLKKLGEVHGEYLLSFDKKRAKILFVEASKTIESVDRLILLREARDLLQNIYSFEKSPEIKARLRETYLMMGTAYNEAAIQTKDNTEREEFQKKSNIYYKKANQLLS